jgi:uncharacterized membrane protein HdeD (DUF308 family)
MPAEDRSTMELLRGSRIIAYALGAICLIAGIVLLAWPERSVIAVARILGIFFIVIGFGQAAEAVTTHRNGSYWGLLLLRGLVNFGIGIALLFVPETSTNLIVWLIGLDFLITGILALIVAFMVPKDLGRGALLAQAAISVGIAVVIFWAGPDSIKTIAAVVIGIVLVLMGLLFLWSGYQLTKGVTRIGPAES